MADIDVRNARAASRYEAVVDGDTAGFAEYQQDGDSVVFTHTVVDDAYEGQGVGSALVSGALDDVRSSGRSVVAKCKFVRSYIDRHPEYADLLS